MNARTGRRGWRGATAALVAGLLVGTTASAVGATTGDGKGAGAAAAAPEAPAAPDCTLAEPNRSAENEWASCVTVDADLSRVPAVGETAVLRVHIQAQRALPRTEVVLDLPAGLELVERPAGFGAAAEGPGPDGARRRSTGAVDVPVGARDLTARVRATAPGEGTIRVSAVSAERDLGAIDEVHLTVGNDAASSSPGRGARTESTAVARPSAPAGPAAPVDGPAAPLDTASPVVDDPPGPGARTTSFATGGWFYQDQTSAVRPSINFQVQVWDQDSFSGDDLLATGVTDFGGGYNIAFDGVDGEGGGQEVYLRFISSNNAWRVRDTASSNQSYDFPTGVIAIADGGTANFGNLFPGDPALDRALHAFDALNSLWNWQFPISGCIDDPAECRQMVVNWTTTSTDGTYYSLDGNDIHLDSNDPDSEHIVIHEGTHALMDAVYEDNYPPFPNCNPHFIFGNSSTGCAWTEGFAEWVPARVLNDPSFRFENGSGPSLETPTWNVGGDEGDDVEGRIAGALIDLSDADDESFWDRSSEGTSFDATGEESYQTFLTQQTSTLSEFINTDRPAAGFALNFFQRASVFQNTIDYTHRDPLVQFAELSRPSLTASPTPHNYSYNQSSVYWGGVAIRPPSSADYDLQVFDDVGLTSSLQGSAAGGNAVDYVIADGNHTGGDYYPQAYLFSGSGAYGIEVDVDAASLGIGATPIFMGTGDIINVRDVFLNAGVPEFFRVETANAGQDPSLRLHDSDPAVASSLVQGRFDAVASGLGGPGVAEEFSFTAATSDWLGLVLVNQAGSGTYTVYRDTTAPTSNSVVIDGGAATTPDTTVDLTLASSDAETGLDLMQISTDGTLDSEPWVPFATSASATLPAGDGTKTVLARFRNNAGATSVIVSDTIDLVTPVFCDGQAVTISGSGAIAGTAGNDVILGSAGADSITGGGGNDRICAGAGNDTIVGGGGNDRIFGEDGNDTVTSSSAPEGADLVDGGTGTDTVSYSARTAPVTLSIDGVANDGQAGEGDLIAGSVENLTGGQAADTLTGSAGVNTLLGGPGTDTLNGGLGNDVLDGGGGNDTANGGDGNDTFRTGTAADGADVLNGDAGTDVATYSTRTASVNVSIDGAAGDGAAGEGDNVGITTENVTGGSAGDVLLGSADNNVLTGGGGDDDLTGSGGNDTLNGGAGNDTLNGSLGDDQVLGGADNDTLTESATNTGADVLDGGAGLDIVSYANRTASVTVRINATADDGEAGEGDRVVGIETVLTGAGADTIVGGAANETLTGGGNNDTITGGGGNDVINGLGGADNLTGGAGNDTVNGGDGNDTINIADGVGGNDTADGGPGTDSATSDAGDTVTNVP